MSRQPRAPDDVSARPRFLRRIGAPMLLVLAAAVSAAAQMEWKRVYSSALPPAGITKRLDFAVASDDARGRVVLFGGVALKYPVRCVNDTWEWDGTTWIERKPLRSPPVRRRHAMVFDAVRRRVVLFGGRSEPLTNKFLGDTWEWDGTTWHDVTPRTDGPSPRESAAIAWDSARRRVVLFGGYHGTSGLLRDTWEWDGKIWARRRPRTSPPGSLGDYLVYDSARGVSVLHDPAEPSGRTWEWDGVDWRDVTPATGVPPQRWRASIAYDPARQRTILHGGRAIGFPKPGIQDLNDTWTWDGKRWTRLVTPAAPPVRSDDYRPMVYDAARGGIFLFSPLFHEGWRLAPRELTASTHAVSTAVGGSIHLSLDAGASHGGKSYLVLGCFDGPTPRGLRVGHVQLPLTPDAYFRLTLQCPGLLIRNQAGLLDDRGRATAGLRIPKLPITCAGLGLVHAYAVHEGSHIEGVSRPILTGLTP